MQLLERALLECGNDIDTASKRLQELCLGAAEATGEMSGPVEEVATTAELGMPLLLAILIHFNLILPSIMMIKLIIFNFFFFLSRIFTNF